MEKERKVCKSVFVATFSLVSFACMRSEKADVPSFHGAHTYSKVQSGEVKLIKTD